MKKKFFFIFDFNKNFKINKKYILSKYKKKVWNKKEKTLYFLFIFFY